MLISVKNDTQKLKSTCHALSQRFQGVITSFILEPFKGAVSKNAVQCRTASKHDRIQQKSTAPFATVQQCHVKLHLA